LILSQPSGIVSSKAGAKTPQDMNAPVTLQQVADAAGVSPATVSRILNGSAAVSSAKRRAVDAAVTRMGFVPNPVARGLAGGKTQTIGVITQSLDSPFYGGALRGIEIELSRVGYSALFVSGQWDALCEARCIDELRSRRVDGIILLSGHMSDPALAACAQALPLVLSGRHLQGQGLFSLEFDNQGGAQLATQHLLDLGHRDIAFITGDMRHPDAKARLSGYRRALALSGLKPKRKLELAGSFTEESGRQAVEDLLESRARFTAIFASNDQMAIGAALALHQQGLRIPQDVSLVGFDDVASASFSFPPLTTVHHPIRELGQCAAAAMLQMLDGKTPDIVLPSPRLVIRESTRAR
jgi:LacI family transcriptional regulator